MVLTGVVHTPYYDWEGRKYIDIEVADRRVMKVKVPFRYGRVMSVQTLGLKTVQEFQLGEQITFQVAERMWEGVRHWVLLSVS